MEQDKHDQVERSAISGGAGRLKSDAAATADELRQFIARMHGKSPQEVLGEIAESGLTRGMVISAIGAFVILVVFTVGPFLINKLSTGTTPASAVVTRRTAAQAESESAQAAAQTQSAEPQAVPEEADLEKATDAMGIGETKTADPGKNPLDNKLDSLLDGVD